MRPEGLSIFTSSKMGTVLGGFSPEQPADKHLSGTGVRSSASAEL
jgi:hypothetical protein